MADAVQSQSDIISEINKIISPERVLTEESDRVFYSQDIFKQGTPAQVVLQPDNLLELSRIISVSTAAGHAVIPRGGGMSYTCGYTPVEEGTVLIDLRRMDKILEINTEDMFVTVECGCTWESLYTALKDSGFRTPFWGTLSGIKASVGGGLSQNSIFWGSGLYGSAVDSVISLEVVFADGSIITTGSGAQKNGTPFFRHYGPDLTGLFTCDTGALGFKATATLKLIPELPGKRYASFDFDNYQDMAQAMSEISRRGLAMELFGFDPYLQSQRMQRESLLKDVKALAGVMKASGSVTSAIKDGAKVALSGRGFMKDVKYSLHIVVEERTEEGAESALQEILTIGKQFNGKEIDNSIPKILRANPFTPLNNVLGPKGERWGPIHTIVPHSKAVSTIKAVEDIFSDHAAAMEKYKIGVGFLLATIAHNGFVIEPVFYWPDEMMEIHKDTIEPDILKRLPGFERNLEAREVVELIRKDVINMFGEVGGVHLQIGKTYNYGGGIKEETWNLVKGLKSLIDPDNRVNPSSLGLD
jgi:FAD/FMN-containing dehydrogenase